MEKVEEQLNTVKETLQKEQELTAKLEKEAKQMATEQEEMAKEFEKSTSRSQEVQQRMEQLSTAKARRGEIIVFKRATASPNLLKKLVVANLILISNKPHFLTRAPQDCLINVTRADSLRAHQLAGHCARNQRALFT